MLIAARVVQGLAAGGLMSLAIAAVGDLVAPRERARYQGYSVSVFAVATVAGPLAGDLLVDHTSWRWVFYVNLPLGVAAVTGLRLRMPAAAAAPAAVPLDLLGAALLAGTTSALMLACIRGGQRYPWGSPAIVSLLCAASALSVGLVVRERRAADPIVPLELLRSRTVAVRRRGAVPGHRRAVRRQRLCAVPADHHRRVAHTGWAVARAHDARHHRVDLPRRPRDSGHRPVQSVFRCSASP